MALQQKENLPIFKRMWNLVKLEGRMFRLNKLYNVMIYVFTLLMLMFTAKYCILAELTVDTNLGMQFLHDLSSTVHLCLVK